VTTAPASQTSKLEFICLREERFMVLSLWALAPTQSLSEHVEIGGAATAPKRAPANSLDESNSFSER
jgi:hypothetical protein